MIHKKISKHSVAFYLTTFLLPIFIYCLILLSYHFGFGKMYAKSFIWLRIPMLGLASISFAYYLRHTRMFRLASDLSHLILSVSYGLSSYILAQESEPLILLSYSFFPILFLTYEWMISDQRHFPFIIGNAILLLVCPLVGIPVTILLYILAILELSLQKRFLFGDVLHTTCNFLFSVLLGSFGIIYYLAPYYTDHKTYSYGGFSLTNGLTIFLSRFLPGSLMSKQFFFFFNKIDMYFGMISLAFAILFFFQKSIPFQKRRQYAIYTLILAAGIELTPLQYLLNLFITSERYTISYSFLFIFWALRLASESYSNLSQLTKIPVGITMLLLSTILGLSWCFGAHNFLSWMLPIHIILLGVAAIVLIHATLSHQRKTSGKIVFYLILVELCFNTFVLYNSNLKPIQFSNDEKFFYQQESLEDKNEKLTAENTTAHETEQSKTSTVFEPEDTSWITAEDYTTFIKNHTNKQTNDILIDLRKLNLLDEEGYRKYSNKLLPNDFEQFNAICHKLGIQDDLFTACDTTLSFPKNTFYQTTSLGNNIYHIACPTQKEVIHGYITYTIQCHTKTDQPIYLMDNSTAQMIELDDSLLSGKNHAYLQIGSLHDSIPTSINYQILCYSMNPEVLKQLPALIKKINTAKEKPSYLTYDIIGIACSYVGFMLLLILLCYNNKEQIYQRLYQKRTDLSKSARIQNISRHISSNRVYYLAFFLPAFLVLCIFIYTDCMPFGSYTMFDEDGIALVLPEYLDSHYNAMDGNTYLSMQGAYASNTYSNNPLIKFYQFFKYLSISQVIILHQILLMLCIGFAGVTMVYYLVHRQNRPISKQDIRLLLPALIYSLNAYMLRCHSFNTWYYVYLLFPLLIIAFERLLAKKKWFAYTMILACCIIWNIQLAMYICIFLVILFFCHQFHGIRDFVRKGIRFTWTSILAAGCGFFVIANLIITYQQLYYKEADSEFPALSLHGNFLSEWKNYMIYSPVSFVSYNDGDLFAYCGIFTLFMVAAYFLSKKFLWQEKIRKLIPILILCISFNGKVLSYLWNGLHYQSGVPNRYTFLLLFLLTEIAYDGFTIVCSLSRKAYSMITVGMILFFLSCQSYANGNKNMAFLVTMLLCLLYLVLHLWFRHSRQSLRYTSMLLLFACLELYSNGLYTGNNWLVESILRYGNMEDQTKFQHEILKDNKDFYRTLYSGNSMYNSGKVYHSYGGAAFNSYVSNYQTNLNLSFGFQSGSNNMCNNYFSNQMGLALSSTRYLFLYNYSTWPIEDLNQYHYIGYYNKFYVFENPNYLSLGFQVPESALNFNEEYEDVVHTLPSHYHNLLAKMYLKEDKNLCSIHPIYFNDTEKSKRTDLPDSFYFTNKQDQIISSEEAIKIYKQLNYTENYRLKLHINYSVPNDGYLYLYANELDGLGYVKKGEQYQTTIDIPNLNDALSPMYYMIVLKENVFQEFYDKASQNQLENITITDDTITGTTNYAEDGYTMLSIPYNKGWSAYIDDQEVEISNPYNAGLFIKTPAGKHTLSLKFVPYGMKECQGVTLGFWIITILLAIVGRMKRKQ